MAIPRWTLMDLERAREDERNRMNSGSTTPILDSLGIRQRYAPGGRVYVDAAELNLKCETLGPDRPRFEPFNDLPGPLPWSAEIILKNSFKKYFDRTGEYPTITKQ